MEKGRLENVEKKNVESNHVERTKCEKEKCRLLQYRRPSSFYSRTINTIIKRSNGDGMRVRMAAPE